MFKNTLGIDKSTRELRLFIYLFIYFFEEDLYTKTCAFVFFSSFEMNHFSDIKLHILSVKQ